MTEPLLFVMISTLICHFGFSNLFSMERRIAGRWNALLSTVVIQFVFRVIAAYVVQTVIRAAPLKIHRQVNRVNPLGVTISVEIILREPNGLPDWTAATTANARCVNFSKFVNPLC